MALSVQIDHKIFPWNVNFETGIAAIDVQHKKLVDLINSLATHMAFQSDRLTLDEVFKELTDYAAHHFATEEKLMKQHLGDDAISQEHEEAHRSFVAELVRMKSNASNKNSEILFEEILIYLSHWLAFHILDTDKHMSKIVLAMQSGQTLEEAKKRASKEMTGWTKVLIETILSMYDTLSSRTLELMREVHERKKAEEKLQLAASVYENTLEAIFVADGNGTIIEINPAFSAYTGYTRDEVIGQNLRELKAGLEGDEGSHIWQAVRDSGHWSGEVHNRSKDGELNPEWLTISAITDDEGKIVSYVGLFSNISQLIQRQHDLEHFAHYDPLTELPNRLLLSDRLDQAVAGVEREGGCFAACYLDLDNFKNVNDRFGHAAGDTLLKEIAKRLKGGLRAQDTLARIGGDEFVLIITGIEEPEESRPLLQRILSEVEKPIVLGDNEASISVSIGVDFYLPGDEEPHLILHQADQAMYSVKQRGKSDIAFFKRTTTLP